MSLLSSILGRKRRRDIPSGDYTSAKVSCFVESLAGIAGNCSESSLSLTLPHEMGEGNHPLPPCGGGQGGGAEIHLDGMRGQKPARRRRSQLRELQSVLLALMGAMIVSGCHTDMWVQPKLKPYQADELFPDGQSAREPIPGTIARGKYVADKSFLTGFDKDGKLVTELPQTLTKDGKKLSTKDDLKEVLKWGQERFNAFCSHCHGASGDGQGMITQRGLILRRSPANYHTDRLRNMPIGHFYDAQTKGFGIMMSSAARVNPDERWAIAAYIRALQLSRSANKVKLSQEDLDKLNEEAKP